LLAGGQYILTAAHPFNTDALASGLTINVNGHATAIYIHPNWKNDPSNYNHDLALIKLDHPLL
jgi:secreted trypsin-like serine protease